MTPAEESNAIDGAVESIFRAGWGDEVYPLLDSLLNNEEAQPGVAFVFVNLGATLRKWDHCESRVESLQDRPELWQEGARKLMVEYATLDEHPRLHKFIAKHKKEFQSDTMMWWSVGAAYKSAGLPAKALSWMKGWKKREGVTAAMAFTVIQSYWHLNKPHQAMETSRYVFENFEHDDSAGLIVTLMAFYEMVYGSLEACVNAIGMVDPNYLTRFYQIVFQHIVTVLENLSTRGNYRELAGQLDAVWAGLPEDVNEIPLLKRFHKLTQIRAAELHGKSLKATWLKLRGKFSK